VFVWKWRGGEQTVVLSGNSTAAWPFASRDASILALRLLTEVLTRDVAAARQSLATSGAKLLMPSTPRAKRAVQSISRDPI
jgi:hypothetical protein